MTERSGDGGHHKEGEDSDEEQLSEEELARERGQPLPDRAAMSTLDADVAIPINPVLAADVLAGSDDDLGEPVDSGDTAVEDESEDDS